MKNINEEFKISEVINKNEVHLFKSIEDISCNFLAEVLENIIFYNKLLQFLVGKSLTSNFTGKFIFNANVIRKFTEVSRALNIHRNASIKS